jgi:DNA-binding transcriptional ArsR family regulator
MRRDHAAQASETLDEVFFALSHSARRLLLERLAQGGEPTVADLAAPLAESPAQITKHLAILERAGLISRRIEGRAHRLALAPGAMRPATDWLEQHRRLWSHSLDRLEQFLDADAPRARKARRSAKPKRGRSQP